MVRKKAIAPTLRKMQVGDVEKFPVERHSVVRVTANNLSIALRRQGVKFEVKAVGLVVEVTRTA